jgi:hypothetical protein
MIAKTCSLSVPFFFERRGRRIGAFQNHGAPVVDLPSDGLAFAKPHRFGNGGGKVDVVLVCGLLPADQLNHRRRSHLMPPFRVF